MPAVLAVGVAALLHGAGVTTASAATGLTQYGLYNTGSGLDPAMMLDVGDVDPNYTVSLEGASPAISPALFVTSLSGLPWQPGDDSTSSFISPQVYYGGGAVDAGGTYDFTTTFDLTGVDLSAASIYVSLESDDVVTGILLNGKSVVDAATLASDNFSYQGFGAPVDLTTDTSVLNQGANTLTFQVFNYAGTVTDPVAIRTEFTASVPEPSTWAMLGTMAAAVLGFGFLRRRRTATV